MKKRIKLIIKFGWIIVLFVVVISYSYFKTRDIARGAEITIESPVNGDVFEESLIEVSGSTKNIANLTLNDRKIFINKDGIFNELILLNTGYNIISFKAVDKFDKETKKELEVVLK